MLGVIFVMKVLLTNCLCSFLSVILLLLERVSCCAFIGVMKMWLCFVLVRGLCLFWIIELNCLFCCVVSWKVGFVVGVVFRLVGKIG